MLVGTPLPVSLSVFRALGPALRPDVPVEQRRTDPRPPGFLALSCVLATQAREPHLGTVYLKTMTDTARLTAALAGRYAIERELGAGGMATVYLARDLKHDRDVALKVLRPELAAVLGAERFLQEIHISARLDHPHILTLIDSGECDGFVWYVLPYVRGESLREKLTREKQLSLEEAVRIATQVASALDYAHRHGLIHRDIKPENILLHEGEAVVADFGIALAVREAGGPRLTESGLSLGTPQYMSPEQATGGRELDVRSDVYSLAAVVYEMLAGEPPHTGPTAQAVIAKLLTERPMRIRTVRDTVPEGIDTAVAKALAKVPADRFGGAAEFATALAVPGAGPGAGWPRRRMVVAASLAGAVALAALAVLWHPWRRPARAALAMADVASVAVLPFENLTGSPNDLYLSDGMTEEVIGQLAQVPGLKVISRTSTEALKGAHLTLRQIADTLGVRHILEGSVRHAGNRIRVAVDLIDATTDAHVWASRYDRDLTDLFGVQDEIARHVADSLVSAVGIRRALSRLPRTVHPGAYEAYLIGRSLMYRRTREGLRGAREQFERAIAQDSAYAPAYAGLASVYQLWVVYAYSGAALDPVAPGVRIAFSQAALAGRRYEVAEREAAGAVALEPSLVAARMYQALGDLLSGKPDRCALASLGAYVGVRAMCLHSLGRVREATQIADSLRAAFKAGTASDSSFSPVVVTRGLAEYSAWTGSAEESLAWLERAYAISPEGEDWRIIASALYDKVRNDPRFTAGLQRARTQIYDRVRRASLGVAPK